MGQGHSLQGPLREWDAAMCDHEHCTAAVKDGRHGTYLVRRNRGNKSSQLYLNDHGAVLQYNMQHPDGSNSGVTCCGLSFPSIDRAIASFSASGIQAQSGEVALQFPVGKQAFCALPYLLNGMDVPSWYKRGVSREQAQQLVTSLDTGRFIVRPMSEPHSYQMHVKDVGKISTFTVTENEDDLTYQFGPRSFPDLKTLVRKIAVIGLKAVDGSQLLLRCEGDPPDLPVSQFYAGRVDRNSARTFLEQPNMGVGSYMLHQSTTDACLFFLSIVNTSNTVDSIAFRYERGAFRVGKLAFRTTDALHEGCIKLKLNGHNNIPLKFVRAVAGTFAAYQRSVASARPTPDPHEYRQDQQQQQQQQQQSQPVGRKGGKASKQGKKRRGFFSRFIPGGKGKGQRKQKHDGVVEQHGAASVANPAVSASTMRRSTAPSKDRPPPLARQRTMTDGMQTQGAPQVGTLGRDNTSGPVPPPLTEPHGSARSHPVQHQPNKAQPTQARHHHTQQPEGPQYACLHGPHHTAQVARSSSASYATLQTTAAGGTGAGRRDDHNEHDDDIGVTTPALPGRRYANGSQAQHPPSDTVINPLAHADLPADLLERSSSESSTASGDAVLDNGGGGNDGDYENLNEDGQAVTGPSSGALTSPKQHTTGSPAATLKGNGYSIPQLLRPQIPSRSGSGQGSGSGSPAIAMSASGSSLSQAMAPLPTPPASSGSPSTPNDRRGGKGQSQLAGGNGAGVKGSKLLRSKRHRRDPQAVISEYGLNMSVTPMDVEGFKGLAKHRIKPGSLPRHAIGPRLNRFRDILPNPATRVRLPPLEEDQTLEYINANYIRGHGGRSARAYIAAQAPMDTGLYNFWRMIWYGKVHTIIMATGFIERGRRKCAVYFPEEPTDCFPEAFTFGPDRLLIRVRTVAKHDLGFYSKRTIRFTFGREQRDVTHFWFTAWPDHDVPTNADGSLATGPTLDLLRDVASHRRATGDAGPLMIHCSAGIGRTGTLLVIDHAAAALKAGECIDINKIVSELREDRMALVQHVNQYKFCCQAAIEYAKRLSREGGPKDGGRKSVYKETEPIYALASSQKEAEKYSRTKGWKLHSKRGDMLLYSLDSATIPQQEGDQDAVFSPHAQRTTSTGADDDEDDDDDDEDEEDEHDISTRWWFRSNFTRAQVEELLQDAPKGQFLVRNSSKTNHYALSLQTGGKIVNMLISPHTADDGRVKYKLGKSSPTLFDTLDELVSECLRAGVVTPESRGVVKLLPKNEEADV